MQGHWLIHSLFGSCLCRCRPTAIRNKARPTDAVSLRCCLVYVERDGKMISTDRSEREGVASCEVLPRHVIGGAEQQTHEILQIMRAVSGPKYETRPPRNIVQTCLAEGNVRGGTGSKFVQWRHSSHLQTKPADSDWLQATYGAKYGLLIIKVQDICL